MKKVKLSISFLENGQSIQIEPIWEKMSKSKSNGIEPQSVVDTYGADVTRLFVLFKAPPEKVLDWDILSVQGQSRWLGRVWNIVHRYTQAVSSNPLLSSKCSNNREAESILLSSTAIAIDSATKQFENQQFNTAVASLMKLTNSIFTVCTRCGRRTR